MNRLFKLQFLGPCVLFAATLGAELAAKALQYAPGSELLWFLNLKVFGIFQRSHAMLSGYVAIDGFQLFGIALPLFLLACLGLVTKARPAFTIATHMSAGYAALLLFSWQIGVSTTAQASLGPIAVPTGAGLYVIATILGACLLSFAITHLLYLHSVGSEIVALLRWLRRVSARASFALEPGNKN